MSQQVPSIIDTGPALNFIATNNQRILFEALGPVVVPERVEMEVLAKGRSDRRFRPVQQRWPMLRKNWISVLPDDPTDQLDRAVNRMTGMSIRTRSITAKDLGETMVIAHAVTIAETGRDVIVLIDEIRRTQEVHKEGARLLRLRQQGRTVGRLSVVNTETILVKKAGSELIKDRGAMRRTYEQMRECDDGLMSIERTSLLSPDTWR